MATCHMGETTSFEVSYLALKFLTAVVVTDTVVSCEATMYLI